MDTYLLFERKLNLNVFLNDNPEIKRKSLKYYPSPVYKLKTSFRNIDCNNFVQL